MKTKTLLATALAAAFGYAASASADYIDLFQDPPSGQQVKFAPEIGDPTISAGTTIADQNTTAYPGTIIGGYRDLVLTTNSDIELGDSASLTAFNSKLNFATSPDITAVAQVQWDGGTDSADPTVFVTDGLGGENLINQIGCGSGCAAFITTVEFADFNFPYEIEIWDVDGNWSILSANSQFAVGTGQPGSVPGPVTADYLFDWFNLPTGEDYFLGGLLFDITRSNDLNPVNFMDIGALQLTINVPGSEQVISVDLIIGPVRKVPEPGVLGLMGIGGLMAGLARRRSKAKALKA